MNEWLIWCQFVIIVSVRLTICLAMTPVLGAFGIPYMARLIIVLAMSVLIVGASWGRVRLLSGQDFALAVGGQFVLGLMMAIGIQCAFASLNIAGRLLDVQMGFSVGAILDPVSKGHSAVMAAALNALAVLVFFSSKAHVVIFTAVGRSFEDVSLLFGFFEKNLEYVVNAGVHMFGAGFAMAAPVVVAIFLMDSVVAAVSRNMPQMNLLFIGVPLKILIGLSVLLVSLRTFAGFVVDVLVAPGAWF